jgi:hypothetical protein
MRLRFSFFALALSGSLGMSAEGLAQSSSSELTNASNAGPSVSLSASHNVGAKRDADPTSQLTGIISYPLSDSRSLSAQQGFTRLYRIDPDQNEVEAGDTVLSYSVRLLQQEQVGLNLQTTVLATLPVSNFSREQGVRSIPGLSLAASRSFVDGRLTLRASPFYRFHINSYKTLADDDSGRYLVRSRYGLDTDLSFALTESWNLATSGQWVQRTYEQPPVGSVSSDIRYNFDVSTSYAWNESLSLAVGYTQTDLAEQQGRVDVFLFDIETTQYYVQINVAIW